MTDSEEYQHDWTLGQLDMFARANHDRDVTARSIEKRRFIHLFEGQLMYRPIDGYLECRTKDGLVRVHPDTVRFDDGFGEIAPPYNPLESPCGAEWFGCRCTRPAGHPDTGHFQHFPVREAWQFARGAEMRRAPIWPVPPELLSLQSSNARAAANVFARAFAAEMMGEMSNFPYRLESEPKTEITFARRGLASAVSAERNIPTEVFERAVKQPIFGRNPERAADSRTREEQLAGANSEHLIMTNIKQESESSKRFREGFAKYFREAVAEVRQKSRESHRAALATYTGLPARFVTGAACLEESEAVIDDREGGEDSDWAGSCAAAT